MTAQSSHRDRTDRTTSKIDDIASFIRSTAISEDPVATEMTELLVIALSVKSPVVMALKQALAESEHVRAMTRIVLATLPENDPSEELGALAPAEIRWAQNPRLLDAHEQLVIGANAAWTGDCMRRDPTKRDAFESFNTDCPEAAGWAHVSFERIWQVSSPLATLGGSTAETDTRASEIALRASINDATADWIATYRQSR
jgi:hypothetical protein